MPTCEDLVLCDFACFHLWSLLRVPPIQMITSTTQSNIETEPVSSAPVLTFPRIFLEADGHKVEVEWSDLHFVPVFRWVAVGLGTPYKELMSTST